MELPAEAPEITSLEIFIIPSGKNQTTIIFGHMVTHQTCVNTDCSYTRSQQVAVALCDVTVYTLFRDYWLFLHLYCKYTVQK